MFRLADEPTFTTTAEITVPTDAGPVAQTLQARFRLLPSDHPAQSTLDGGREFLTAALISVSDVCGDDGAALPDSEGLRARLIDLPFVRVGLMRAYLKASSGAAVGN